NRGVVTLEGDDFPDEAIVADEDHLAQRQRQIRTCTDYPAGDRSDVAGGGAHGLYIPLSALRHSASSLRDRVSKLLSNDMLPPVTTHPPATGAVVTRTSVSWMRS